MQTRLLITIQIVRTANFKLYRDSHPFTRKDLYDFRQEYPLEGQLELLQSNRDG